jgi:thiamine biosynthesis lipoprotein ApbE
MIPPPATVDFTALGTTVRVATLLPAALEQAAHAVKAELEAIDSACSRFRPDSEIAAVNRAMGEPVVVSPLLLAAIEAAMRAAVLTDGAVTPTVGTAVIRLGYDRDFRLMPADGPAVTLLRQAVPGWRCLEVDRTSRTVRLPAGVSLDLDATAKALVTDRAAAAAETVTGGGVLVAIGGDLAVAGDPPDDGWLVWVGESDDDDAPGQLIRVRDGGVATSGTGLRRWRRGGADLHHIVDPSTGLPAAGRHRTASVAAASCLDANIAATASIVVRVDTTAWLRARKLPARLVAVDGTVETLAGWPAAEAVPV